MGSDPRLPLLRFGFDLAARNSRDRLNQPIEPRRLSTAAPTRQINSLKLPKAQRGRRLVKAQRNKLSCVAAERRLVTHPGGLDRDLGPEDEHGVCIGKSLLDFARKALTTLDSVIPPDVMPLRLQQADKLPRLFGVLPSIAEKQLRHRLPPSVSQAAPAE